MLGLAAAAALSGFETLLPPVPLFLAARALEGASHLAIIVAAPSCLVHVVAPGRRTIVIGLWGTFFSVAFLIAGALGLPLLAAFGLSGLFAAHEIVAAALALAAALFIPADPPRAARANEAARKSVIAAHVGVYADMRSAIPALCFLCYTGMYLALQTLTPELAAPADRVWLTAGMPAVSVVTTLVAGALAQFGDFAVPPRRLGLRRDLRLFAAAASGLRDRRAGRAVRLRPHGLRQPAARRGLSDDPAAVPDAAGAGARLWRDRPARQRRLDARPAAVRRVDGGDRPARPARSGARALRRRRGDRAVGGAPRRRSPAGDGGGSDRLGSRDGNALARRLDSPYAHGGDRIAAALAAHGVRFLFTLCGGHIAPILVAAKARGVRIVDARDEATAVFAADAVARLTGRPGVAAVTAGPGVTNALTALENAKLAQSPLLLIGGAAPTALQGRGALQDIDQGPVVAPFVKWAKRVRRVRDLAPAIAEALAVARQGVPGPVFVECPVDLLYDEKTIREWYADAAGKGTSIADRLMRLYLERHAARLFAEPDAGAAAAPRAIVAPSATEAQVEAAATRLTAAERPLVVVGSQALVGAEDPTRIAEALSRLGAPVYLSGMARGLLGRGHPLQRLHQRRQALREADCVLLAGAPCDFRLDYGRHVRRSAALIAANRSAREARLNRRPDVAAIGDAGDFLVRLAARVEGLGERRSGMARRAARRATKRASGDRRAGQDGGRIRQPDRAAARDRFRGGRRRDLRRRRRRFRRHGLLHRCARARPAAGSIPACSARSASAPALRSPRRSNGRARKPWILFGDGACGWSLTEFDTFVRHGIPVVAVVGNDAGWTQIAREQVKMLGDDVGVTLSRAAYHEVAAAFGGEGILVRNDGEIADGLARARAAARAGRPALVNVWLDRSDFRDGSISM